MNGLRLLIPFFFLNCLGFASSAPPSVILILADDLAVGDLGPLHSGEPSRTPHLDRLASQSVCFDQAYSGSCVCAPARAALLTGRYPHRTGVVTLNMSKYPVMTQLKPDETTIADIMRNGGYVTGLVGKWHVGRGEGFDPLDRGFDECCSFDGSDDPTYYQYRMNVNGETIQFNGDEHYLTNELTDRAIEFVRRHRERPFFLHLAHYAPHRPIEAPQEVVQKYLDRGLEETTATIYAMIEVMDTGIGRLLNELDDLGIADNTIVVFASDNGPDPLTGDRFNGNLRGTKYQCYEGGIRVPMMVRWMGQLNPGRRQQLVQFIDVLPTIAELCDVEAFSQLPIDGDSFVSVLKDPSSRFAPTRYWQWNRATPNYTHNATIRQGNFKLIRPFVTRNARLEDSDLPPLLYDLSKDPTESNDLSKSHPKLVTELNEQLQKWTDSVESDRKRPVR